MEAESELNLPEMQKVIENAIWNALTRHKKLGESVAVWQDGHVVVLPAEDIPTPKDDV